MARNHVNKWRILTTTKTNRQQQQKPAHTFFYSLQCDTQKQILTHTRTHIFCYFYVVLFQIFAIFSSFFFWIRSVVDWVFFFHHSLIWMLLPIQNGFLVETKWTVNRPAAQIGEEKKHWNEQTKNGKSNGWNRQLSFGFPSVGGKLWRNVRYSYVMPMCTAKLMDSTVSYNGEKAFFFVVEFPRDNRTNISKEWSCK